MGDIVKKKAVIALTGTEDSRIRRPFGHRILKSSFVPTCKPDRFKARWCLRGHLDPDAFKLVPAGKTSSPTMSQIGRTVALQMIASRSLDMNIGDFKESGRWA